MKRNVWIPALGLALALTALPLSAQAAPGGEPRHLDVTGSAEVVRAPNQAVVTLGVEAWAADLAAARKSADTRMAKLLALPAQFGISNTDVRTDFASIEPRYENDDRGNVVAISGYRVTQILVVVVKDLAQTGPFVTAALTNGANRLDGVAFSLADPSAAEAEARLGAVRAAKAKAEALAAELGQRLGRPLAVSEAGGYQPPVRFKMAAAFEASAPGAAFAPGQITVSAQVNVSFELLDR